LLTLARSQIHQHPKSYQPDLVGLSGYTHEATKVKELARTVRRVRPQVRIVVGGHHATVLPQDYNLDCFDAIVRGEGCAPFRALVAAAAAGKIFAGIENVMIPGAGFNAEEAARMPQYPELSTLPLPRRDLWDPRPYQCIWPSERHPHWETIFPQVALVRTSFGCLMDCSFCMVPSLSGGRHMTRPPEQVADEITVLPQKHIYFCDDETFQRAQRGGWPRCCASAGSKNITSHGRVRPRSAAGPSCSGSGARPGWTPFSWDSKPSMMLI
jgi:radical SAM superfamily enzyme YgiQ (UPF0313 family)